MIIGENMTINDNNEEEKKSHTATSSANNIYQTGKGVGKAIGKEGAKTAAKEGAKKAAQAGAAASGVGLPLAVLDMAAELAKKVVNNANGSNEERGINGFSFIIIIIGITVTIFFFPVVTITGGIHGLVGASVEKYHEDQYNEYSYNKGIFGSLKKIFKKFFDSDDEAVGEYQSYEPLAEGLIKNKSILDKAFLKSYEIAKDELAHIIIQRGYDADLTINSFEGNGYPFQDINYAEIISIVSQKSDYNIQNLKYKKFKALFKASKNNKNLKYLYCMKVEDDYKEIRYYYNKMQRRILLAEGEEPPEGEDAYTEIVKYGKVTLKHYDLKSLYEMLELNPNEKNEHWDVNNIDMIDEQENYLRFYAREFPLGTQDRTIWDWGFEREDFTVSENEYAEYQEYINQFNGELDEARKKLLEAAFSTLGATYSQEKRFEEGYFDCSSLTYWCYLQIGIDIGVYYSTAANECHYLEDNGYKVSDYYNENIMLPGDLIFYSSKSNGRYKDITHTAIYIGDGKMIDASSTKMQVVYRDVWGKNEIVSVCRPLK